MSARTETSLTLEPALPAPEQLPAARPRVRLRAMAIAAALSGLAAVTIAVLGVIALSH